MRKKVISMILTASIATMALTGCSGSGAAASQTSETTAAAETTAVETTEEKATEDGTTSAEEAADSGTHIVVDHGGNEVEVPNKITRVVIDQIPILSTYMSYFEGNAPYIVGYCGSFKSIISDTVLKNIAPELLESSETTYAQSELNIEEIIKLKPDVILYNSGNTEHAEILKKSGIPAIGFATVGADTPADPIDRYKQWLQLLEDVFGEEGKMNDFTAAGDAIVADVEARISEIPETGRPSAMILWKYQNGIPMVSGAGTFGTYWLERLGVTDVVVGDAKGFAQSSVEQLYQWNPDIIYVDGPGLIDIKPGDILANTVEGIDFSTMDAVKNGWVYDSTLGMWNWFTPNPDAPLVLAWMACKTYPEAFADYPLEETIKDYYRQFYNYDVTADELAEMLELK